MPTNSSTPAADRRTFAVTVDFDRGTVLGFGPLAESLVEFIQEDRVTAGDDIAQVCAETLAHYLDYGDVDQRYTHLLVDSAKANLV